jgi:hypothetical protein
MTREELAALIKDVESEGARDRGWTKVSKVLRAIHDEIMPPPKPAVPTVPRQTTAMQAPPAAKPEPPKTA